MESQFLDTERNFGKHLVQLHTSQMTKLKLAGHRELVGRYLLNVTQPVKEQDPCLQPLGFSCRESSSSWFTKDVGMAWHMCRQRLSVYLWGAATPLLTPSQKGNVGTFACAHLSLPD